MKAVLYTKYGSPEVLELKEIEKPMPKDNEVLIKIHAATVSAVDSIFRKGDDFFARMATGLFKPKNPVLGDDFAGEVEAAGKNVKRFKIGDKVYGATVGGGAHLEYLTVSEDGAVALKPDNMTFEEAACIPYGGLTALPFLRDTAKIQTGQKILIIGASGSVGTFAVQLAKYFGAEVTGVCSTMNIELVKSLGADRVMDYKKEDFTKSGKHYDIIFDTVGKSSFTESKGSLKTGGLFMTTYITLGILFQMLWTSKIGSKKAVISFTGLRKPDEKANDLIFLKGLIEAGKLKSVIDQRFPFSQIAEAHRLVDSGHKRGNVVVTM